MVFPKRENLNIWYFLTEIFISTLIRSNTNTYSHFICICIYYILYYSPFLFTLYVAFHTTCSLFCSLSNTNSRNIHIFPLRMANREESWRVLAELAHTDSNHQRRVENNKNPSGSGNFESGGVLALMFLEVDNFWDTRIDR